MAVIGKCLNCGSSLSRDESGRIRSLNPEPGCPCADPPKDRYTIDKPMGSLHTWYLWDGDPDTGVVIATGDLSRVLRVLEERA
jgi:hypothetical protein